MLTKGLEINRVTPNDKKDYFDNISNDKKERSWNMFM